MESQSGVAFNWGSAVLRLSGPSSVSHLLGSFERTSQVVGGRPVYAHERSTTRLSLRFVNNRWQLSRGGRILIASCAASSDDDRPPKEAAWRFTKKDGTHFQEVSLRFNPWDLMNFFFLLIFTYI